MNSFHTLKIFKYGKNRKKKSYSFPQETELVVLAVSWKLSKAFVWADVDQSRILSNSPVWSAAVLSGKRLSRHLSETLAIRVVIAERVGLCLPEKEFWFFSLEVPTPTD